MATAQKPLAIFPDLPRDVTIVDSKGDLTTHWKLYFEQLTQALQSNLKPEGFVMPQLTADNINMLTGAASVGNIVYDTTANSFRGCIYTAPTTYTFKTFTLV